MDVRKWKYAGLGAKHSIAVSPPVSDGRHSGGAQRLCVRRSTILRHHVERLVWWNRAGLARGGALRYGFRLAHGSALSP